MNHLLSMNSHIAAIQILGCFRNIVTGNYTIILCSSKLSMLETCLLQLTHYNGYSIPFHNNYDWISKYPYNYNV